MKLGLFLSLLAYGCATTFSPGPNNVLLLSSGAQYGFKKCIPLLLGIWTGLITVMLLCGFGCSLIGELIPQIEPYARIVGGLYILWLAYKTLVKQMASKDAQNVPLKYYNGFLLQFLNVKILMLGVAAYCSFILPYDTAPLPTLIFACTMAGCAACGNLIWITAGALLFPVYQKYYKVCNVILTLLLLYCVYKVLFV